MARIAETVEENDEYVITKWSERFIIQTQIEYIPIKGAGKLLRWREPNYSYVCFV